MDINFLYGFLLGAVSISVVFIFVFRFVLKNQKDSFLVLAGQALKENSTKLNQDSTQMLSQLLAPVKENLKDYQKTIENIYQQEARERFSLQKELEKMFVASQRMEAETMNLTRALFWKNY